MFIPCLLKTLRARTVLGATSSVTATPTRTPSRKRKLRGSIGKAPERKRLKVDDVKTPESKGLNVGDATPSPVVKVQ